MQATIARAGSALERGRGAEAVQILQPLLRAGSLPREEEMAVRAGIAEAWLLQDSLTQAAAVLGRPPDTLREPLSDAKLSILWRLHGRVTFARGEQSRAIALHTRALKHAQLARDSRLIGLAHHELARCYRQVGDSSILREHLTEAASALHAAGDRRHLSMVHRLSGVSLAQSGRYDEATAALRLAERLAMTIPADDVLAGVIHNQANVALLRHAHEEALALAERSVALYQTLGSGRGLAVALATLGQIYVQLGDLDRAEHALTRALDMRNVVQTHETTGAVFDSLAQIHLMRGSYEQAGEYLRQANDAYGAYGTQTMRWYEWSVKVLGVKLAIRRGAHEEALALAGQLVESPGLPQSEAIQADLAVCEALVAAGRVEDAERRLRDCEARRDPRSSPANWGEFLRVRGTVYAASWRYVPAHHDFAQSANVFDLLGERYQAALSQLALAKLASDTGARATAIRYLDLATTVFKTLGAQRDLAEAVAAKARLEEAVPAPVSISTVNADDAIVKRVVDAALFPELLARETAAALLEITDSDSVVVFVTQPGGSDRILAAAGCDADAARAIARAAAQDGHESGASRLITESLGKDRDAVRLCTIVASHTLTGDEMRRFRTLAAVARQGFELCGARERPPQHIEQPIARPLEPLLPGFICASAAMNRVADQIQRLAGHTLTVLITGESGTGKDLVARAIHVGSPRSAAMFLPYNCTTTTRELADSQLFGHRRGSFTGAVTDQQGLIRSAAGGTLFLDEIGDLPLDVQPKLLRFLEQGEIMPVGETRPQAVDVRVLAATNADLEQRVAEGKFREDLYYRLSVIRIHVPPLRERREEIPHLSTFFLRESCERLSKPDVYMSSPTLDLFARYWWPGNIRQLRNEIQRAVALSPPGGAIEPEHLSPDLSATELTSTAARMPTVEAAQFSRPGNLASAVHEIERHMIQATLDQSAGNVSETARVLGLTRRGLYLKMRRLGLIT